MKKTVFTLVLALLFIASFAQSRMVVWQKDGQKVAYQLSEQPTTTFENGKLVIRTKTSTVIYHLENVLRYTYEGVESKPIDGIYQQTYEAQVTIDRTGQTVSFAHLRPGTAVSLYGLNGMLLDTRYADAAGSAQLSVTGRPRGVYMVKTGKQTIKLTKP